MKQRPCRHCGAMSTKEKCWRCGRYNRATARPCWRCGVICEESCAHEGVVALAPWPPGRPAPPKLRIWLCGDCMWMMRNYEEEIA